MRALELAVSDPVFVSRLRDELHRALDDAFDRVLGARPARPATTAPAAEPAAEPGPEPKRMTRTRYAATRGYAPRTVSKYCKKGMPHVGNGRGLRILVDEADAWIAGGGSKAAAQAAGAVAQNDTRLQ